jgi:hypothetical protein
MTATMPGGMTAPLPLAPKNPLRYRERLTSARLLTTGTERLRDALRQPSLGARSWDIGMHRNG